MDSSLMVDRASAMAVAVSFDAWNSKVMFQLNIAVACGF
jgi:hypothetical protein